MDEAERTKDGDRIQEGDCVKVYWENITWLQGEVIGIPYATGDSWKIKDIRGTIFYVQMFCKMERLSSGKDIFGG